jgi:signal recognition particle subunit SRP54
MFDTLTNGFKDAALKLRGQARLTEANIAPSLDAVKRSLLDADVDLKVVKEFLENVRAKAMGQVVSTRTKSFDKDVGAGEHFVALCHEELIELLGGDAKHSLVENDKGPTVVLLVGLQGAGKTTHAAKIAHHLKTQNKKRPLLVAADVYRPAAREQLKVLGEKIDVPVFTLESNSAVEIATKALEHARAEWLDLVIIDTAGRLAIDDNLMTELANIKAAVNPQNILLVIDAMIGQDAVRTASAFDARLSLTGVVLTKLDGDTRGGAALSVKKVTGKNILFTGVGEGIDRLEDMRAEGMASRILGMGDIVGLMQDFGKAVTEDDMAKQASRMMQGEFTFEDFLSMTGTLQKMGPLKDIIAKTPLASQISEADLNKVNDRDVNRMNAIVHSMTKQERKNPDLLLQKTPGGRSRMLRIAKGSGHDERAVKELIEKFMQMRQMVQLMSGFAGGGGGLLSKIPGLGGLNQMANMARAMKQMGGMGGLGGMGGMGGLSDLMGGLGGMGGANPMAGARAGLSAAELAEINRMRKKKKEEKRGKQKRR